MIDRWTSTAFSKLHTEVLQSWKVSYCKDQLNVCTRDPGRSSPGSSRRWTDSAELKNAVHVSASYLLHLHIIAVLLFFFSTVILCGSVKVTWNGIYFKISFWTLAFLSFASVILNKRPGTDFAELAWHRFCRIGCSHHTFSSVFWKSACISVSRVTFQCQQFHVTLFSK